MAPGRLRARAAEHGSSDRQLTTACPRRLRQTASLTACERDADDRRTMRPSTLDQREPSVLPVAGAADDGRAAAAIAATCILVAMADVGDMRACGGRIESDAATAPPYDHRLRSHARRHGPPNTGDKLRSGARVHAVTGAGMRRHVHAGNHAAESFVSFIPLFGRLDPTPAYTCPDAVWHRTLRRGQSRQDAVGVANVEQHAFRHFAGHPLRLEIDDEQRLTPNELLRIRAAQSSCPPESCAGGRRSQP